MIVTAIREVSLLGKGARIWKFCIFMFTAILKFKFSRIINRLRYRKGNFIIYIPTYVGPVSFVEGNNKHFEEKSVGHSIFFFF